MERIPITQEGFDALQNELRHLKAVDRPANIKAIEEARAHGDLSENAEFEAAKDRQGFIEARIGEIGYKIANADIVDLSKLSKEKVIFGSRVLLENVDTSEEIEYQLIGPEESDVEKNRISIASPLGRAILGKKPGDEINFNAPGGKKCYELIEIL